MVRDPAPGGSGPAPVIEAYGDGGFRVSGARHEGAILVGRTRAEPWPATTVETIDADALAAAVFRIDNAANMVLLGCGRKLRPPPPKLVASLRASGLAVEPMDTGAACRTLQLLLADGRDIVAALLPVP